MEWKEKSGRNDEKGFSLFLPTPIPSMFFPAHFSLHLLQYLNAWTDYSLELEDSSDLREQSWDHCTVSHKFIWSNSFEINDRCKSLSNH